LDPNQKPGVGSNSDRTNSIPVNEQNTTLLNADWYALRLLNLFRLFLLVVFAATFFLVEGFSMLGSRNPILFAQTLGLWSILAVCFYVTMRRKKPTLTVRCIPYYYSHSSPPAQTIYQQPDSTPE